MLALRHRGVLVYDGNLTGHPVSNTSTSYPDAASGWMSDEVRLGCQVAPVCMHSLTYGRLWLSQQLAQYEEDNRHNNAPIRAIFRLDAGLGRSANTALLIEMDYASVVAS
ncbi:MAG TPA: hypothetical protein PLJ35_04010 [Anaerolineae bacterium]|nr:hypothetical protein [Anaerolineae bacterium]HPL27473.1 hypothetical protein [Anaerolineae bacterium]